MPRLSTPRPDPQRTVSSLEAGIEADEFSSKMAACGATGGDLAVGLSGGADSLALTLLAADWARVRGLRLTALTVDHGLRTGSRAEAERVAAQMAALEIPHRILTWQGGKSGSGIQERARAARLRLLTDWCRDHGVDDLLLAHHREDQVETVLMRAERDSGPDGLAGMAPAIRRAGVWLRRPLLPVAKSRLRATCRARGLGWVEDPSNEDSRFERVRLREIKDARAAVGLSETSVWRLAAVMARLKVVLDSHVAAFLTEHGRLDPLGYAVLDRAALRLLPENLAERVLMAMVRAVGGAEHPPRRHRRVGMREKVLSADAELSATLGRCLLRDRGDGQLLIIREATEFPGPVALSPGRSIHWDRRFVLRDVGTEPLLVQALGELGARRLRRLHPGLGDFLRNVGVPGAILPGLPAVFDLEGRPWVPHLSDIGALPAGPRVTVAFEPIGGWLGDLVVGRRSAVSRVKNAIAG